MMTGWQLLGTTMATRSEETNDRPPLAVTSGREEVVRREGEIYVDSSCQSQTLEVTKARTIKRRTARQ